MQDRQRAREALSRCAPLLLRVEPASRRARERALRERSDPDLDVPAWQAPLRGEARRGINARPHRSVRAEVGRARYLQEVPGARERSAEDLRRPFSLRSGRRWRTRDRYGLYG